MAPGQDGDPGLDRQRAEIAGTFRELWVPRPAGQLQVLTERACAEARNAPAGRRRVWHGQSIIEAVRGGARPGDPLPPPLPSPFIADVAGTEVILTGRGLGRCVAVLFSRRELPEGPFRSSPGAIGPPRMMATADAGPLRDSAGFAARAYARNLDCACALTSAGHH